MRKYQGYWETLKGVKQMEIFITNADSYSNAQKARQFRTLRKAISKEKYMDFDYKFQNPRSEITSEANLTSGSIIFTLIDNPEAIF